MSPTLPASLRLDKWLWAARLRKTRSLAADEIAMGHSFIPLESQDISPISPAPLENPNP